jgi:hypothetical protein
MCLLEEGNRLSSFYQTTQSDMPQDRHLHTFPTRTQNLTLLCYVNHIFII